MVGHTTRPPIVVGVDGSRSALSAVRWAAREAVRRGVPIKLVHVYPVSSGSHGGILDAATVRATLRNEGRHCLRVARSVVATVAPGLRPFLVLESTPAPPDFAPAQQQAYETLAERLAGWQEKYPEVRVRREVVRDNPSAALLHHAPCPVAIVRTGADS